MPLAHCPLPSVHVLPKSSSGDAMISVGRQRGSSAMSPTPSPPTPVLRSHAPPPQCDGLSAAAQPITDSAETIAANAAPLASSFMARSIQPFAVNGSTVLRPNYFEVTPTRRSRSPGRVARRVASFPWRTIGGVFRSSGSLEQRLLEQRSSRTTRPGRPLVAEALRLPVDELVEPDARRDTERSSPAESPFSFKSTSWILMERSLNQRSALRVSWHFLVPKI